MVSSITPGAAGANALGADQRLARGAPSPSQRAGGHERAGDRIDAASLTAARDSVRVGLSHAHQALAIGHEAQSMLLLVRELAAKGAAEGQAKLDVLLSGFKIRVELAIAGGVRILEGAALPVQAEPGAAPVEVAGVDLRLKSAPAAGDVLQVGAQAKAGEPGLSQRAQVSLERLQVAMEGLFKAARALEAHQGFLGAAEGAGVRHDLDADSARLLALQARQGLAAAGKPIANAEPQAVLSLFRA